MANGIWTKVLKPLNSTLNIELQVFWYMKNVSKFIYLTFLEGAWGTFKRKFNGPGGAEAPPGPSLGPPMVASVDITAAKTNNWISLRMAEKTASKAGNEEAKPAQGQLSAAPAYLNGFDNIGSVGVW